MAGDERIKDFTGEVALAEIEALLATLYLAVDDTSFSDAKKILLKTLLFTGIIQDDEAYLIDYLAVTPKSFYASVMTTVKKGIGILSTDLNVTAQSGDGLLKSSHQTLMKTQWWKDWFIKEGEATSISSEDIDDPYVMSFNTFIKQTYLSIFSQNLIASLTLPKKFKSVAIQCSVAHGLNSISKFVTLEYAGVEVEAVLIAGKLSVVISADGTSLRLTGTSAYVLGSFNITAFITGI